MAGSATPGPAPEVAADPAPATPPAATPATGAPAALRQFADAGVAVLVVAAVGRTKDKQGRTSYAADGLNLASFRESSELEFGADDAFILAPDEKDAGRVVLRHLKARHTEAKDIPLNFDRRCQRFSEAEDPSIWKPEPAGKLQSALRQLWDRAESAADDDQEGGEF